MSTCHALSVASLTALLASGCGGGATTPAPPSPASQPSPTSPAATTAAVLSVRPPTGFGALTYFTQHCARCHGPEGQFWGEKYARDLPLDQLRATVERMAVGPGQAPVDDAPLTALTELTHAIGTKMPYAEVTAIERRGTGWVVDGEAGTEVRVTLEAGGRHYPAKLLDSGWEADLPAESGQTVDVLATKNGRTQRTRWKLP